jgi:hypothetical protein
MDLATPPRAAASFLRAWILLLLHVLRHRFFELGSGLLYVPFLRDRISFLVSRSALSTRYDIMSLSMDWINLLH